MGFMNEVEGENVPSNKATAIELFLSLPRELNFQGVTFTPVILHNGTEDARLVYRISDVDESSSHSNYYHQYGSWRNPFTGTSSSFLFIHENISDEEDFRNAIHRLKYFLKERLGIITK